MTRTRLLPVAALVASIAFAPAALLAEPAGDPDLTTTITALDGAVFDAYNRCDLTSFAAHFSPRVEFYHDTGGATFDRKTVVDNTRKYICNKVRRELIPGSLRVYPIKDFGAIEEGEHRFCQSETGACEGIAKFLMVWQFRKGQWQITRVMSYGHRAITE